MKNSRRNFIKAGLLSGAAAAAGIPMSATAGRHEEMAKPLSILILGGTGFIGPHMVREALRRGHSVALFNRGRTNASLFPDLETIIGDRDGGLDGLEGRRWDVVVDNSGYVPRLVADSARMLAKNAHHYLFISTASVYADFRNDIDEDSPLARIADETVEKVTGETYGALKALCESRVAAEFGADRSTVLRPTYIAGPGDHTDRLSYWPVRTRKGGEMIWPGSPGDAIQFVDVRDLAVFVCKALEQRITGTYNMANPAGAYTMGELLDDCQAVSAATVDPLWISEEFAYGQNLIGGRALPIWHPKTGAMAADGRLVVEQAKKAGLKNRPERETLRDILSWWDTLPGERTGEMRAGLDAGREAELIAAWKER